MITRTRLLILAILCGLVSLIALSAAFAQTPLPPAADHYEIGVFRSADATGPQAVPFSRTIVTQAMLSCNHRKSDDPVDGIPNPIMFVWDDPTNAGMECRVVAPSIALSLPLGVGYKAAVRAVAVNGTGSDWSFASNTFRRAPRGLPCPGGQAGVMVSGEADLNGRPVQVQLCVNQ